MAIRTAYEVVMPYHLHMPSYFLGTFTEYPYKVVFADGTQVKFRRNGMWREIKSRSRAVPSAVVPAQIADYVARNFPGTFLVGIEHTCREWEVKLNNTIELTFDDKRFALKEYDD